MFTIEYRTKVDPSYATVSASFKNSNIVTVANSVMLTHVVHMEGVTSSNSHEIENQILAKSGTVSADKTAIAYTVNINPNGVELNGQTIQDTIPDGLRLDIASVKLVESEI